MGDLKLYGKTDKGLKIFSSDLCMKFGIEKCNTRILKRGIKNENCDILLQNDLKIFSFKEMWELQVSIKTWGKDINTIKNQRKIKNRIP